MSAATEVPMPRLSDSMEEGTVLRWIKAPGDAVAIGDELVEIETDKANMVFESEVDGVLLEILVAENESAAVGVPLARIGEAGGAVGAPAADSNGGREPAAQKAASAGDKLKTSPVARRTARNLGIDLQHVVGTGPGGRIVKRDVEAAGSPPAAPAEAPEAAVRPAETGKGRVETVEPTKLQRTVALRMAESKATIPHIHLSVAVDVGNCIAARSSLKRQARDEEAVPSFNDMVVKASGIALRRFPRLNGAWRDDRFELYERVNVGIAVAAPDALLVPTIRDADRKGLSEIATESRALAARVRDGSITPPELSAGTFTISNLGMYGVEQFAAVINPSQAAILAVGAIVERPVAVDGEVSVAPLMKATLACDHRILYGADGAEFLAEVRRLLEEPIALAG